MNPETAELATTNIAAGPATLSPGGRARILHGRSRRAPGARLGGLRADPARMAAVRDSWRALWSSRLLVWLAGVGAVLTLGYGSSGTAFNPPGITSGFGWLGNLLAAPAARWDSSWYLVIARYGYRPDLAPYTSPRMAYFPLYPLAIRALSWLGSPLVLAGVLISLAAFSLSLYGIHRLTTLELGGGAGRLAAAGAGGGVARLAVLVMAFSPMAFYFSAVYSESLYLALSVALFWCARQGRWAWVGVLGALAGASRSTGLMLVVPALVLYLYGPREDRAPDRAAAAAAAPPLAGGLAAAARRRRTMLIGALRPRYRVRRDILWLALMPAGVALYSAWLAASGGEALGPFHAAQAWDHHLTGPFVGVWDGVKAGWDGVRQLLSFQRRHIYFTVAGGSPFIVAWHNLMELAFLLAAVPMTVGVLRRLPLAYGAYVIAALALPLSYPVTPQPLMSIPRYLLVLFPLAMWLAAWLAERPHLQRPALVVSALLMVFFVAQFSTWHWVA